jgi:hypothetical protein
MQEANSIKYMRVIRYKKKRYRNKGKKEYVKNIIIFLNSLCLAPKGARGRSGPEAGRSARTQSTIGFRVLCYVC